MELQAITGELYIVNGEVQNGRMAPGLLAVTSPGTAARGRNQDSLFIHLSLSGQPEESESLSQDIVDSLSSIYFQTPGSVTAALRKAIIETNRLLLEFNFGGTEKPREGSLICAALRGEELFTAQVGESFALLGHNFGIERLPPSTPEPLIPLGRSAGLDIRYYHHRLQPGDTLLLSDPRMAHIEIADVEDAIINSSIYEGIAEITSIIGESTARAILIEFSDDPPLDLPDVNRAVASRSGRKLSLPIGQPIRLKSASPPTGLRKESARHTALDVESVETTARIATSMAAKAMSRAAGWMADFLSTIRRPTGPNPDNAGWALPTFFAVFIPLAIGILVAGVYVQRGQVLHVGELKLRIEDNFSLAQQAGNDFQAASFFLSEIKRLVKEGQDLRPGDPEFLRIGLEAQAGLDRVSGVSRLGAQLFKDFDPSADLTAISTGDELNGGLFVLDSANNLVYALATSEGYLSLPESKPQVILFGDQAVGSHVVGPLIDIVWRPRGISVTRDGLATLDGRGALITYYPNFADTRAVSLGLSSEWIQPKEITTYNERLYILDAGLGQIRRYFAEGDGFTVAENQQALTLNDGTDISEVVDFAIYEEDGSVILLYKDGRLRRYVQELMLWGESDLAEGGLLSPMVEPTSVKISGSGLNSSIFVSDPGSGRIIQFSLGGTFLAQYRASDEYGDELFTEIVDFTVVENPLRIFFVTGNKLYVAALE
jgi:hypothetical protein